MSGDKIDSENLSTQLEKSFAEGANIDLEQAPDPMEALRKFDSLRIKDTTQIEPPIPIVTINDEIICTRCNISTISGESKSGKSAFTGIIIAGAISPTGIIDGLPGLVIAGNTSGHAVVHLDTEQARHKQQANLKSIIRRAGMQTCPDYFLSYNIRSLEISTYQETTTGIFEAAHQAFGGLHLCVVDGVADYITDVNEPVEANAIVKYFEELAIKYNCPIILVVHTNPGSDKERGHLGSQCQRKSESVLMVKNEGDISFIEPKLLRMAGRGNVPRLQFIYDKVKGYHIDAGVKRPDEELKAENRRRILQEFAAKVFGGQKSYKYGEACEMLKEISGAGSRTVKDLIRDMQKPEFNLIEKGTDGYYRLVQTGAK